MKQYSIMIKPASALCNMRCRYCFYEDESSLRGTAHCGLMSAATARRILEAFRAQQADRYAFVFQGGEPTLAGIEFFRAFSAMERELGYDKGRVSHAIQTNGLLMDAQWAEYFKENRYLVGLSLDGTRDIHDHFRPDAAGEGSYKRVIKAAELMNKAGVDFNILTVVTPSLARHIGSVFRDLVKHDFRYQQYIICLPPMREGEQSYTPDENTLERFLKQLFDLWYNEFMAGNYISVRYFDNLVYMLQGQPPELCSMCGHCNIQYLIEADGSVYPCDFYALDEYRLGNILTDSIEDIDRRRMELGFIQTSMAVPEECKKCKWAALCRNGCRRERQDGPGGKNIHCRAYRSFFEHAYPGLMQIARMTARR